MSALGGGVCPGGVSAQGGVCPRGVCPGGLGVCLPLGGVCQGRCLPGGVSAQGGCLPKCMLGYDPTCGQYDRRV